MPPAASNAQAKGETPSKKWKTLEAAWKEVQPHVKEVIEAAQCSEDLTRAKSVLRNTKETHLGELRSLKQEYSTELAKVKTEYSALRCAHDQALLSFFRTTEELNKTIKTLEEDSKARQDAQKRQDFQARQKLLNEFDLIKMTLSDKTKELEDSQTFLKGKIKELEDTKNELKAFNLAVGWGNGEYSASLGVRDFEQLAGQLHGMVNRHFTKPFLRGTDMDGLYGRIAASRLPRIISRQIPISNSPASQSFRVAVVEAVIATEMVKTVFYNVEVTSIPKGLFADEPLKRLLKSAPKREAMLRSLLTDALEPEIETSIQSAIQVATGEIMMILDPIIDAMSPIEVLKSDLERFFQYAAKVWQRASKLQLKVAASLEGQYPELFVEYGENDTLDLTPEESVHTAALAPPVVLFPQIVGRNNGKPIHHGFVLHSEQTVSVKASVEAYHQKSRLQPPVGAEQAGTRRRRQSFQIPETATPERQRRSSGRASSQEVTQMSAQAGVRTGSDGITKGLS